MTMAWTLEVGTQAKWKVGFTQLQPSKVTLNPDQGPLGDFYGLNNGKCDYKKRFEGGTFMSLTQDLEPVKEADGFMRQAGIFWALGEVTASVSAIGGHMQRHDVWRVSCSDGSISDLGVRGTQVDTGVQGLNIDRFHCLQR